MIKRLSGHGYAYVVTRFCMPKIKVDLGNGLTAKAYSKEITALRNQIITYTTPLSKADGMKNQIKKQEAVVRDWNERILAGVASKFGKNSDQYEMAGGVKKSERKKPVRKKKGE